MKRILLSFTILFFLIGFNIYSEYYLINYCDDTYVTLEVCADNIKKEAYPEAKAAIDKLLNKSEKHLTFMLSIIIGDADISKAYGSIVALSGYLDDALYERCLGEIRVCQGNLREIKEENRTDLGNIL